MSDERTDGMYLGMKRADYDAIDRYNWSWVKHMKRSPLHFETAKTEAEKDTDALRQGRALHVAALEPERFAQEWCTWDQGDRRGNAWKAFRQSAEDRGAEILTATQAEHVMGMVAAIHGNARAKEYLVGGAAEVSLLWTYEEPANGRAGFKVQCKSRLDMAKDKVAITDVKSTRDASPEAFARQAWNLDYYAQLAMYQDAYATVNGGVLLPVRIVAVENTSPYVVQVYKVPDHLLDLGRDTYRGLLRRVAECRAANRFDGYASDELELDLPRWARSDDDLTGLDLEVGEAVQ